MKRKRTLKRIKRLYRKTKEKLPTTYVELLWRIELCWFYRIPRTAYRNLKYGIRNLIIWFPIIWRDRVWDEYFLYRILEFKFKRMEQQFRNYSLHVGAEKTADKLRICRCLCKRLAEEDYTTPFDERNKPHHEWFHQKVIQSFNKEPNENGIITVISHNEPDEPENRWIRPAAEHEDMLNQQDVDLLCKIIQKHIRGWWD